MTGDSGFFMDGTRKIHYVLVTHEENLPKLEKFISNLKKKDIETETATGTVIIIFYNYFFNALLIFCLRLINEFCGYVQIHNLLPINHNSFKCT